MTILSIFFVITTLFGTPVNAWDTDQRCLDLGKTRQLDGGHLEEKPRDESYLAVASTVDMNLQANLDSSKKHLRGFGHRNLGLLTFQMKVHWEEGYCWQAEWEERNWCMSCHGGTCNENETIWIQDCNDANIQRWVWEPVPLQLGTGRTGKLKPYNRQDLCMENVGTSETGYSHFGEISPQWWWNLLRPCDPNNNSTQIYDGFNIDDSFRFLSYDQSQERPERCITMAHHPRAGESMIGEYCEIACDRDDTCLWDAYNVHSNLPETPDEDATTFCAPQALMQTNEFVESGQTLVNWNADAYVEQYNNGRFVVRRGFPDRPGQILLDSELDRSEGDYVTKLQHDGTLLTKKGTDGNTEGDSLWKIDPKGGITQYFLGIECDLQTLSIYEYIPEDPGQRLWTNGDYDSTSAGTVAPGTDAPGTDAPGTDAPGTVTPGTDAPGTDAPGTDAPGTDVPGTVAPGTEAPDGKKDFPQVTLHGSEYCDTTLCGLCQGDCDADEQCEGSLQCFLREANQEVPGCSGGADIGSTTSFCYDPNWEDNSNREDNSMLTPTPGPGAVNTTEPGTDGPSAPAPTPGQIAQPTPGPMTVPTPGPASQPTLGHTMPVLTPGPTAPMSSRPGPGTVNTTEPGMVEPSAPAPTPGPIAQPTSGPMIVPTPGHTHTPALTPGPTAPMTPGSMIPQLNGMDGDYCTETNKCGLCEGDCDTNDDCQEGLICYQRDPNEEVPGCEGNDDSKTDYCIQP